MKNKKLLFWIFTILFSVLILSSAVPAALQLDYAVEHFTSHLHYPAYLLPFIGVANLVGLAVLLVPGHGRLKEWAYAGFAIDLLGAVYSDIRVGDAPGTMMPVIIAFVLLAVSYILHRKTVGSVFLLQKAER